MEAETETFAASEVWASARAKLSSHKLGPKELESLICARRVFATTSSETSFIPRAGRHCTSMRDVFEQQSGQTQLWELWKKRTWMVDSELAAASQAGVRAYNAVQGRAVR